MGWRVDNKLQPLLRESAQGYLSDAGGPAHFRAVRDAGNGFDAAAWRPMGELGWTGILLSENVGGAQLELEPALTLAEELGRTIAPEPFIASAVIAGTLLAKSAVPRARLLDYSPGRVQFPAAAGIAGDRCHMKPGDALVGPRKRRCS